MEFEKIQSYSPWCSIPAWETNNQPLAGSTGVVCWCYGLVQTYDVRVLMVVELLLFLSGFPDSGMVVPLLGLLVAFQILCFSIVLFHFSITMLHFHVCRASVILKYIKLH